MTEIFNEAEYHRYTLKTIDELIESHEGEIVELEKRSSYLKGVKRMLQEEFFRKMTEKPDNIG